MKTVGWAIRIFLKSTAKSASVAAVAATAFVVGREFGKFEVEGKIEKSTEYGDMIITKNAAVAPALRKEEDAEPGI